VRRAEILQLHGAWTDALDEARRACEELADPPGQNAVGAAFYQAAELHRLRGEFAEAEQLYRQASQRGRGAQPGLALLRLAQGQVDAATASIRSALDEVHDRKRRSPTLAASVDIALAARDVSAARTAADELSAMAGALDAPYLHALSAHATGAVLLAEGDPRAALTRLRRACILWQNLDAPYEAARTRLLTGLACQQLADADTGEMEIDAARQAFARLGAAPDLARVETLSQSRGRAVQNAGGLSARELQVLQLIATGRTNRAIAHTLNISEKTVARHVSNIFTKLDLSSRAAATAYAYEHHLV
jgi:ATP/maltotriose-dependent transcriptional regulator MalT